jgi:hypothetical protein
MAIRLDLWGVLTHERLGVIQDIPVDKFRAHGPPHFADTLYACLRAPAINSTPTIEMVS